MGEAGASLPQTMHTVCGLCRNSSNTTEATEVSSCGVCVYHKECAVGIKACECGFPYRKLLGVGETCMACRRPAVGYGRKLFCRLHYNEAINQMKIYSKRGVECKDKNKGMCTPYSVLKANGLLLQKLDGEIWKTYLLEFARQLPVLFPNVFVIHSNVLLTLASRLKAEIDAKRSSVEIDVFEVARGIFEPDGMALEAVQMLKDAYPKLPITHKGKIPPKGSAKGINSIVNNGTMIEFLQQYSETAHRIGPLVAKYPGAAEFLCELIDKDDAILVQNTSIIFVKNAVAKVDGFLDAWKK